MKKGFLLTLMAAVITMTGVSVSHASAPVLRDLPDVIIGDYEDNIGTDNNYFVFTSAFVFDDYVSDDDPIASLKWSFDEGDDSDAPPVATQWFQINDKDPIHVGSSAQAADSPAPSLHSTVASGNWLNETTNTATFRNIVFTPTSDTVAPWVGPSSPTEAALHEEGKVVTFYVSDGFNAVSNSIIVKSIDNTTTDQLSGASLIVTEKINNQLGAGHAWVQTGLAQTTVSDTAVPGELRVTLANAGGFKVGGWKTFDLNTNPGRTNSLLYSDITANNYVRAKFFLYRGGQPTTAANEVPGLRIRVNNRNAYMSQFILFPNQTLDNTTGNYAGELAPSTEQARPSLYRVDLDPIDVANMAAQEIDRSFEVYADQGTERGFVAMTESTIGIYPKTAIADNTPVKTYTAAANDFNGAVVGGGSTTTKFNRLANGAWGSTVSSGTNTLESQTVVSNSLATGLTIDVSAFNAQDNFIITAVSTVTNGTASDQGNRAQRIRIDENQLYKVKFHATSTIATANQSHFEFTARALGFSYINTLLIEAGQVGGSSQPTVQQLTPGTGNALPAADKDGSEAGGYYTMIFNSPISKQMRPETVWAGQPMTARMPIIKTTLDDEGESSANAQLRRRDIIIGMTMRRSADVADNGTNYQLISGRVTLDKVSIYRYPSTAVTDGSENYGL